MIGFLFARHTETRIPRGQRSSFLPEIMSVSCSRLMFSAVLFKWSFILEINFLEDPTCTHKSGKSLSFHSPTHDAAHDGSCVYVCSVMPHACILLPQSKQCHCRPRMFLLMQRAHFPVLADHQTETAVPASRVSARSEQRSDRCPGANSRRLPLSHGSRLPSDRDSCHQTALFACARPFILWPSTRCSRTCIKRLHSHEMRVGREKRVQLLPWP